MIRILIIIFFLKAFNTFAQNVDTGISKKEGIIVFEGKFEMYFIETSKTSLATMMKTTNDTITANIIYTTDGAKNFKQYLNQQFTFDSALFIIRQENHLEKEFIDTPILFWKHGYIAYAVSKSYKLQMSYKTLFLNDKALVIALENYLPIEMFTAEDFKKSKKKP
ncbi:MAG: hypothetical protein WAU24_13370 [Chitinophagaceae bacterium]